MLGFRLAVVCKPDSDACNPYVMMPYCQVLAWGQVKLAHLQLHQLIAIASSFTTTTKSYIYVSEADLLTVRHGNVQCCDITEAQPCAFSPWCLPCYEWFASCLCAMHAQSALAEFVNIETCMVGELLCLH